MTMPGEPAPGFGEVPDPDPQAGQAGYTPPPPYGPPPAPQPYGQPVYPPPGYPPPSYPAQGYPAQGYPPPGYPAPGYPPQGYYPYPPQGYWAQPQTTNGMAIASMVLGILWIYWVGSVLALIFGYVARSQIKRTPQGGNGFAIAGIVLGWVGIGTLVVVITVAIAVSSNNNASLFQLIPGAAR